MIDNIAKVLIQLSPAPIDKIVTFDDSNEYLQMLSFLYFIVSFFNCNEI